ncbi:MAG TPA: CDP-alcohol phosphatidyltransferase family protein [Byssovorax sp.]
MSAAAAASLGDAYRRTLKPGQVETLLDAVFFRPMAFVVVKLALPTPITPNMLTLASIGAGLAGAYFLRSPTPRDAAIGAGLMIAYGVLDCADGQLARARGTSSRLGRILDGASDYIVGVTSGAALGARLGDELGGPGALLAVAGVASVLAQGTLFDHFKNRYLTRSGAAYREGDDLDETLAAIEALRERVRDGAGVGASASLGLHHVYATFLRVQKLASGDAPAPTTPAAAAAYARAVGPVAKGWAYLGPSTHVALLAGALVSGRLVEYVWIRVTAGNAATLALLWLQRGRERDAAGVA